MNNEKEMDISNLGCELFDAAFRSIDELLCFQESKKAKIDILDFAIRAIGREMAIAPIADFWKGKISLNTEIPGSYIPRCMSKQCEKVVQFQDENVVGFPWNKIRFSDAICDIQRDGFKLDTDNYYGDYFPELHLLIITNGNHHAAVGSILNQGAAKVAVYLFSDYFNELRTDGEYWYFNAKKERVLDYRLAVLYELLRQKAMLSKG